MSKSNLDELTFRKRERERRMDSSVKPEAWAIIVTLAAALLLVAVWVQTSQQEVLAEVVIHAPAATPDLASLDTVPLNTMASASYQQLVSSQPEVDTRRWIYQCREPSGAKVFRSEGCAAGEKMLEQTPVLVPDRERRGAVAAEVSAPVARDTGPRNHGQVAYIPSGNPQPYARTACDIAKAQRKETRDRLAMSITYDGITRLDEMVREACK